MAQQIPSELLEKIVLKLRNIYSNKIAGMHFIFSRSRTHMHHLFISLGTRCREVQEVFDHCKKNADLKTIR